MRRVLLLGGLVVAMMVPPVAAHAAPPNGFVVTFDCDNGQSYDISFGAGPNQGSVGFIVGTNDVMVAKLFEIIVNGQVVYSFDRGSKGFQDKALLSCSGEDPESGALFTLEGFIA